MNIKYLKHNIIDANHGFFTRRGGVSSGLYKGLNVGFGSDDEKDFVTKNRELIKNTMQCEYLCTVHQIHSNKVAVLDKPWDFNDSPSADAIVTKTKNVAIGVLTADCGSVLFHDNNAGIIGCAHAGWKGAKSGILENTVDKMLELGGDIKNISVASGPMIGCDSYEVGQEFFDNFILESATNNKFFVKTETAYMFDLNEYINNRLLSIGIDKVGSINTDENTNTYKQIDDFYSYRRSVHKQENDYGRQISVIVL